MLLFVVCTLVLLYWQHLAIMIVRTSHESRMHVLESMRRTIVYTGPESMLDAVYAQRARTLFINGTAPALLANLVIVAVCLVGMFVSVAVCCAILPH